MPTLNLSNIGVVMNPIPQVWVSNKTSALVTVTLSWADMPVPWNGAPVWISAGITARNQYSGWNVSVAINPWWDYMVNTQSGSVQLSRTLPINPEENSSWREDLVYELDIQAMHPYVSTQIFLIPIERYRYVPAAITSFAVQRCNADGALNESGVRGRATCTFNVPPYGNYNTKALSVKWREAGTPNWSTPQVISITALGYAASIPATVLSPTFEANKSYEIMAELVDVFATASNMKPLGSAYALLHLSADKTQMAIGKYCEAGGPGLDIAKGTLFRNGASPAFSNHREALAKLGIQFGVAPINTAAGTQSSGDISFAYPYAEPPQMFFTLDYTGTGWTQLFIGPLYIFEDTFRASLNNTSSTNRGAQQFFWMAIGTPP